MSITTNGWLVSFQHGLYEAVCLTTSIKQLREMNTFHHNCARTSLGIEIQHGMGKCVCLLLRIERTVENIYEKE